MSTRAVAAFALLAALAPKMPEQCNKVLDKSPAKAASAEPAPPPPPPPSTATAPPIWTPPEAATPATATAAATTASASGNEYALARAAAEKKDWKKVKTLLDKKVRSGRGTPEEIELLHDACEKTKDKACLESLKKLAPSPEE